MAVEKELPRAVFLMGPTASGKTDLAVAMAQQGPFEIISVDSALVYRGMDIGSAKPDKETLQQAPHRLIDICDPSDAYSAARFRQDALREMEAIVSAGNTPLLVGGTMLYFKALEFGLAEMPEADPALRQQLEREMQEQGLATLHRRLCVVDPEAGARIHPNDPQRTLRALEVHALTGRPLSQIQQEAQQPLPYCLVKLALAPVERSLLHQRIEKRFQAMLDAGLEEEVRGLWARGDLDLELPAMRSVGYRQMLAYIAGDISYDEMVERAVIATRQLAKRQMTWLRSYPDVIWLDQAEDLLAQGLKLAG